MKSIKYTNWLNAFTREKPQHFQRKAKKSECRLAFTEFIGAAIGTLVEPYHNVDDSSSSLIVLYIDALDCRLEYLVESLDSHPCAIKVL